MPGRPFLPGQSGNPGGRPRGTLSFKRLFEQRLKAAGAEMAKQIVDAIMQDAINGPPEARTAARKMLVEYIDGKVPSPIELGGPDGGGVEHLVTVVYSDHKEPPI